MPMNAKNGSLKILWNEWDIDKDMDDYFETLN